MSAERAPSPFAPARRPFYGWVVVVGAFLVLFVGFGAANAFGAFFHSLRVDFNATRAQVSLAFAITAFLYLSFGSLSGLLADRFGPRRLVIAGVLLATAGLLLAARANTLWQVYVTYGVGVGVGVGCAYVPVMGAIQRWFVRRRAFAAGIAAMGTGLGTLIMPPVAAWFIDRSGWRSAYAAQGLIVLVGGLAGALLIERAPEARGLLPDGDRVAAAAQAGARLPVADFAVTAALRSRAFWLLCFSTLLGAIALNFATAHLAPYARDHGHSEATGALLVGLIGAGSAGGRLALGGLADRFGRRRSLLAMFAVMAVMMLWWLVATNVLALALFAVIFGAATGGFVALLPALTPDYFGTRNTGAILGLVYTGGAVGALLGPTLAGAVYDLSGSYVLPILFGAFTSLIAVACLCLLAEPQDVNALAPIEPAVELPML